MAIISSLAISARLTMNLHNLNNEGTEGNQQQTRMVHVLTPRIMDDGKSKLHRSVVNGISGDMFKRILVDHLIPILRENGQPLSPGAGIHDPDRINSNNPAFVDFCEKDQEFVVNGKVEKRRARESEIMARMLSDCAATDLAGALVTRGRAVGRKSVAEIGWVVGVPELTHTEQYFHVKYAPEGRGDAAGGNTVSGQQAIFHRPASSGDYAFVCNLDFWRVGLNDITRRAAINHADRITRSKALLHALASTLLKPTGAQRNTQNPHIMGCRGVIATSSTSLPAPTISPLVDEFGEQIQETAKSCNTLSPGSIEVKAFSTLAEAVSILASFANDLDLPEVRGNA